MISLLITPVLPRRGSPLFRSSRSPFAITRKPPSCSGRLCCAQDGVKIVRRSSEEKGVGFRGESTKAGRVGVMAGGFRGNSNTR